MICHKNVVPGETEHEQQIQLERMYKSKTRPVCPCRTPGIDMYIAKVGDLYIVKRMPNTGGLHSPECDSYEPPAELSGLGEVMGSAIKEDAEQGITELKFAFSMTKLASRKMPTTSETVADSVKSDGSKLTLRSTLHYLWEEAGFNRWTPAMAGKRNWYVIRKHLLQTAADKLVKGHNLSELLYIPESFSIEKKDAINQKRIAQMSRMITPNKTSRSLMMVIGEVKEFAAARYGHKVVIKHAPDFPFMIDDESLNKLFKLFNTEVQLAELDDTHLIMVATFSMSFAGIASIEEIALMATTPNWIPFETVQEKVLIEQLTLNNRRFMKGLRYNLNAQKPLACAVLTDTEPQPTALYIVPPEVEESYQLELDQLIASSQLASWVWDSKEYDVPEMPPAADGSVSENTQV